MEEYPDHWSPVADGAEDCPDISGTYYDLGQWASADNLFAPAGPPRLSDYFLKNRLEYDALVTLWLSDNGVIGSRVEVAYWSDMLFTLSLEKGDFTCEDGKVWLDWGFDGEYGIYIPQSTPSFPFLSVAGEWERIGFANASDGSLVGEFEYRGAGLFFWVIPLGAIGENFASWPSAIAELRPR